MARAFSWTAVLWLAPTLAFASEGAGHGGLDLHGILTSTEFLGAVENVALLGFILWWFGRGPIGKFLKVRRSAMEVAMAEAAEMKAKAETRYTEYTERLGRLNDEVAKLKADIERAAEEDKKRILADADEAARRMRKETEALIEQHAQALSAQVRRDVVEAAVRAAQETLAAGVSAADQERLAEDFRKRVSQHNGGRA